MRYSFVFLLIALILPQSLFASAPDAEVFARVADIPVLTDKTPSPVWMTLEGDQTEVGVWDNTAGAWVARVTEVAGIVGIESKVERVWINGRDVTEAFRTGDPTLWQTPIAESGTSTVTFRFKERIGTTHFDLAFASHSAVPEKIGLRVRGEQGFFSVLATEPRRSLDFPRVVSEEWEIVMVHRKPVFLAGFPVPESDRNVSMLHIGFLREPEHQYQLYTYGRTLPEAYQYLAEPSWRNAPRAFISAPVTEKNLLYIDSDYDSDGVGDIDDNCPDASNPLQEDEDQNGQGDACDDYDGDGVINIKDNCSLIMNYGQENMDGDKEGDACDETDDRLGEKYPWLSWAGIIFAALTIGVLTVLQLRTAAVK